MGILWSLLITVAMNSQSNSKRQQFATINGHCSCYRAVEVDAPLFDDEDHHVTCPMKGERERQGAVDRRRAVS
jgi:hypothetical protein